MWLLPEREGLHSGYEQKTFNENDKHGRLRLVASHDGRDGSVTIHQDAEVFATVLNNAETVSHALPTGQKAWVQVVRGEIALNGVKLRTGDAAQVKGVVTLDVSALSDGSEILLFDLPYTFDRGLSRAVARHSPDDG